MSSLIEPQFSWVVRPETETLDEGKAASLEATIELAHERAGKAVAAVCRLLNASGSQVDPDDLAARIYEARRRLEVVNQIAGLQVALGAAGKL